MARGLKERSWSVRSLSLVCSALVLLLASRAAAQDLPDVDGVCAPHVTENRRATVQHEGAVGLWFHADVARCMLGRLQALPLYAERVSLFEERLTLTNQRQALTHEQVQLAQAAEERAVGALEAAERGRREAEEDRDAWYRHPALWFVVGAVVIGALGALGIWGVSQLRVPLASTG
jgi:hypothetical protein